MNNDIKLIIFDCDGTLIDSEKINNSSIAKSLNALGFPQYDLSACLDKFVGKSLTHILEIVANETGQTIEKEDFLEQLKYFVSQVANQVKPINNANNLLEKITINKCVASNGNRDFVTKTLKHTKLYDFFGKNNIFTQDNVKHPKPAPDLFLYAAKSFNVSPQNVMVIEDSIVGITAAKNAGMYAVGFFGSARNPQKRKNALEASGADVTISDIIDSLAILDHINNSN